MQEKCNVINQLENMYGSFINGAIVIDNKNEMDVRNEIKHQIPNINVDVYVTISQFGNMTIIKM